MKKNVQERPTPPEGILVIDKAPAKTAFSIVSLLRKITNQKKIGHAGTLDPFATGVMVLLLGTPYTRLADQFLNDDKEYLATVKLGVETDSYDCDGQIIAQSERVPSCEEVQKALEAFQGEILQTPPMFSAKKVAGQKLYHLARKGIVIERKAVPVKITTDFLAYEYPYLRLRVRCSKGTYVRSIAHDLGAMLNIGAHLVELRRVRSGRFLIESALSQVDLENRKISWQESLIRNTHV